MGETELVDGRDQKTGRFLTGNNGGGRTKGSRNKLNEEFFENFLAAWKEHGANAMTTVAMTDPATFVRVAASLMPKEMKIEHAMADLTDEQIEHRARELAAHLGIAFRPTPRIDGALSGEEAPTTAH